MTSVQEVKDMVAQALESQGLMAKLKVFKFSLVGIFIGPRPNFERMFLLSLKNRKEAKTLLIQTKYPNGYRRQMRVN
jgi:hypothetical protein